MNDFVEIRGYEGLYWINRDGVIKSKYKIKTPSINKDEYYIVGLSKNGKRKSFYVHRLLAETFIPNPDNLPQVNHKDENKLNNSLDNLEWCTQSYNFYYGTRGERSSKTQRLTSPLRKPILQYTLNGDFVKEYSSACEAARELDIHQSNICKCCKGIYRQSNGYIWKYKEI